MLAEAREEEAGNEPVISLVGICELDLNSIDAIDAIYEEDQYEYEGYLHTIL